MHYLASLVSVYQKLFLVEIKFGAMYTRLMWYYVSVFYLTIDHFGLVFFCQERYHTRVLCVNSYILNGRLYVV